MTVSVEPTVVSLVKPRTRLAVTTTILRVYSSALGQLRQGQVGPLCLCDPSYNSYRYEPLVSALCHRLLEYRGDERCRQEPMGAFIKTG